jgi:hypothetical protein
MGGLALKILGFVFGRPIMSTALVAGAGLAIPQTREMTQGALATGGQFIASTAADAGGAVLNGVFGGGTNPDGTPRQGGFDLFGMIGDNLPMLGGAAVGFMFGGDNIFSKLFSAVALGFVCKLVGDMVKNHFNTSASGETPAPALAPAGPILERTTTGGELVADASTGRPRRDPTDLSGVNPRQMVGQSGQDHLGLPQQEGPEADLDRA